MKSAFRFLFSVLLFTATAAQAAAPVIAHEAPASIASGTPVKLIARVAAGADEVDSVVLHLVPSPQASQIELPMTPAGANMYYLTLDADKLGVGEEFRYYIEASSHTSTSESEWFRVRVTGRSAPAPAAAQKSGGMSKPLLIAGGGAVAVVAGVALLGDSGGSDSGDAGGDSGGDVDVGDQVVVRTATDRVDQANATLPKIVTVEADAEIGGRTIDRVRVRIEFDAEDGAEERFEASYNNAVILADSTSTTRAVQQDVAGVDSSQVQIWVLSSEVGANGRNAYSWTATVTYFLSP